MTKNFFTDVIINVNMMNNISNINFKGYDVLPLRALYMQGLRNSAERTIWKQMKNIAEKEALELIVNVPARIATEAPEEKWKKTLSIWGQDRKAFVCNAQGKQILWNTSEAIVGQENLASLSDFRINAKKYMPRGGNYYIGYKENGEKWVLINGFSLTGQESFSESGDMPTEKHIVDLFDVKPENIYKLYDISNDLDEVIRPIGYPYVLVNDYKLSFENLEKMREKFPNSIDIFDTIEKFLTNKIRNISECDALLSTDEICKQLEGFGFIPIRIAGRYCDDINYMNALAFENKNGNISYITNSTKKSYPELTYLEKLFEEDLREKVPRVDTIHYITGGKRTAFDRQNESCYSKGFTFRNGIMDILANRKGGIHCMTAEVPDFDKIG